MEHEPHYFAYTDEALAYLKSRDARLAAAIDVIGPVRREVVPDIFSALMKCIVGQQIATKAQMTIWRRMIAAFGDITPHVIAACPDDELQQFGLTFRKVSYMKSAADCVLSGNLDLEALAAMPDDEVCRCLSRLPGIGVWTAEMVMTFSMQRPDVMSFGDLAILRGLRMLHHHRCITPSLFAKYRRRYSPYGSLASLYLWAIAGGAIPGMRDYAPKKPKAAKNNAKRSADGNEIQAGEVL